ncbi:DUF1353 domain-containing protein [Pseudactinotalea sp. HY158]|uniref:DUF1353 domain-containing protein n=1 Tax=Pseudactinotalea sp. HY158 TaxID=2654547 RepID=UPI00129CC0D9|nr:DUF1353 domain-containing protein [Pseudactinotalea sp. HY158]QGH69900.1 DUF1353 domain-containing protein [Pseudactinotalea sp. HY158]
MSTAGGRFEDAADGGPLRLDLRSIDGHDFQVLRRFAYVSAEYEEPFVAPSDPDTFRTDLASVPWIFTWLVPRSGIFLPAAVLHDATVRRCYTGPYLDRAGADRLFRRAARDLGTGVIRCWLMWAAVTMATLWSRPRARWYWRGVVAGLIAAVVVLGALATGDLFGVGPGVPWMGHGPLWTRILGGAAGALVIPSVLALSWGRRLAPAGVIAGITLAFLLHVTVAIAVLYALYRLLERLVSGPSLGARPPAG